LIVENWKSGNLDERSELLLLPVGFFKDPGRVTEQVRMNIWNTLILKMQQDGLLPVQAQGLPEVLPPVETLLIAHPRGTG